MKLDVQQEVLIDLVARAASKAVGLPYEGPADRLVNELDARWAPAVRAATMGFVVGASCAVETVLGAMLDDSRAGRSADEVLVDAVLDHAPHLLCPPRPTPQ